MTDGPYCDSCGLHRVLKAGDTCPVCLPDPVRVRNAPPPRMPLDKRHIATSGGEA